MRKSVHPCLVIAASFLLMAASPASPSTPCNGSCGDPNWIERHIATTWVTCCIDLDGIGDPHDCSVERQERGLYELQYPHYGPMGTCYAYYCAGAQAISPYVICAIDGCTP